MTLADLEPLNDEDVVAHGLAPCMGRTLASEGTLPTHPRFDVVSVCVNLDAGRARGVAIVAMAAHIARQERSPPWRAFLFAQSLCRSDTLKARN